MRRCFSCAFLRWRLVLTPLASNAHCLEGRPHSTGTAPQGRSAHLNASPQYPRLPASPPARPSPGPPARLASCFCRGKSRSRSRSRRAATAAPAPAHLEGLPEEFKVADVAHHQLNVLTRHLAPPARAGGQGGRGGGRAGGRLDADRKAGLGRRAGSGPCWRRQQQRHGTRERGRLGHSRLPPCLLSGPSTRWPKGSQQRGWDREERRAQQAQRPLQPPPQPHRTHRPHAHAHTRAQAHAQMHRHNNAPPPTTARPPTCARAGAQRRWG